jgi:hypothetical protein
VWHQIEKRKRENESNVQAVISCETSQLQSDDTSLFTPHENEQKDEVFCSNVQKLSHNLTQSQVFGA